MAVVVAATRGIVLMFVMADIAYSSDNAEWIGGDGNERAHRWGELETGAGEKFYCPNKKNLIKETPLILRKRRKNSENTVAV